MRVKSMDESLWEHPEDRLCAACGGERTSRTNHHHRGVRCRHRPAVRTVVVNCGVASASCETCGEAIIYRLFGDWWSRQELQRCGFHDVDAMILQEQEWMAKQGDRYDCE